VVVVVVVLRPRPRRTALLAGAAEGLGLVLLCLVQAGQRGFHVARAHAHLPERVEGEREGERQGRSHANNITWEA
jgi:hypothetical protein